MAINPYTGMEEDDPAGFAAAPPSAMPAPPMPPAPAGPVPIPGAGNGTMAPGQADVPELAQAQAALQQVDAVLGPGQSGGAGAPAPPTQGPAGLPPAPVQPPPLAGLMQGGPGQQRQAIRQQQVSGLEQGRALDDREQQLTQQGGDLNVAAKTTDAAAAELQAAHAQAQEDERSRTANLFAVRQQEAQTASAKARDTWVNAKPSDWFDKTGPDGKPIMGADGKAEQDTGKVLLTSLGIALAHMADELNRGRGIRSNIGQQAMAYVDNTVEKHRVGELQRIEQLHNKALAAGQDEQKLGVARAAALAQVEDKYAGINKRLEAEARAQRAQMGMEAAAIDRDQAVVARTRKTLEAEQRRLDSLNVFVDRQATIEAGARRRAAGGAGGAGGKGKPLTEYQQMMKDRHDDELAIPNLDGSPAGQAKTKQEAVKIRAGQEATAGFVDNIKRLQDFIDREGTIQVPLFESSARKELEGLMTSIAGQLTIMNQTGVLVKEEYQRYKGIVSPEAWQSNEGAKDVVGKLAVQAQEYYARKVRSQGVVGEKPADQAPTSPEKLPTGKPGGTARWPAADTQALQWANAHPTDPMAAQILDGLRRKYGAGAASGI